MDQPSSYNHHKINGRGKFDEGGRKTAHRFSHILRNFFFFKDSKPRFKTGAFSSATKRMPRELCQQTEIQYLYYVELHAGFSFMC